MAKKTLQNLGVDFQEYDITSDRDKTREMQQRSQRRTVPQIFIDDYHVGGNDDLQDAVSNGKLKQLLKLTATI